MLPPISKGHGMRVVCVCACVCVCVPWSWCNFELKIEFLTCTQPCKDFDHAHLEV